jgi:hypothetical protein
MSEELNIPDENLKDQITISTEEEVSENNSSPETIEQIVELRNPTKLYSFSGV